MEIWKDIPGVEGKYQISSLGRVKSVARSVTSSTGRVSFVKECIRSLHVNHKGYLKVNLRYSIKDAFVHRLVAIAFIDNPDGKQFVNHKDGNKQNNRVENLEWASAQENSTHAVSTGLMKHKGDGNPMSKLTEEKVKQIKRLHFMGSKIKDLSSIFNVSWAAVYYIVNNKRWRHVAI